MALDQIPHRLKDCTKALKEIESKIKTKANDAYWHRRWAGDALKGLRANPKVDIDEESDKFAEWAIEDADALLKAYKEREENGKDG